MIDVRQSIRMSVELCSVYWHFLLFVWLALRFARQRSMTTARALFLFSITYLPLLLGALVANRLWI